MSPTAEDRIRAEEAAVLIEEWLTSLVAEPPVAKTSPPAAAQEWLDDLLGLLYGYLKNRQPDDQLVIQYVAALRDAELAEEDVQA